MMKNVYAGNFLSFLSFLLSLLDVRLLACEELFAYDY